MTRGSLISVALFFSALSRGALLFSNGAPNLSLGLTYNMTDYRFADDFEFSHPVILTGVNFWGLSLTNNIANDFSGNVSWAIYDTFVDKTDIRPGNVVHSGTATGVTPVDSGWTLGGGHIIYALPFSLGSPRFLPAGRCWLELHEGTSPGASDNTVVGLLLSHHPLGNSFAAHHLDPPGYSLSQQAGGELSFPALWPRAFPSARASHAFAVVARPYRRRLAASWPAPRVEVLIKDTELRHPMPPPLEVKPTFRALRVATCL